MDIKDSICNQLKNNNTISTKSFTMSIQSDEYFNLVNKSKEYEETKMICENIELRKDVEFLKSQLVLKQKRIIEDANEIKELWTQISKENKHTYSNYGWTACESLKSAGNLTWGYTKTWINPSDWVDEDLIKTCQGCDKYFNLYDIKHHCRQCGNCFCCECSNNYQTIVSKGWNYKVRVCSKCVLIDINQKNEDNIGITTNLPRILSESVVSAYNITKPTMKSWLGSWVTPEYWIPDSMCLECNKCRTTFNDNIHIHHCRQCGYGYCLKCSDNKRNVQSRGWTGLQRVCDICIEKPDEI
jgi:hypothetical protein